MTETTETQGEGEGEPCPCCGRDEDRCDCQPAGWPVYCGRCPHLVVEDGGARFCDRPRPEPTPRPAEEHW